MPESTARPTNGRNFHTPRATARRALKRAQKTLDHLDAEYPRQRSQVIRQIESLTAEIERIDAEARGGVA